VRLVQCMHCEPEVAADSPQRSAWSEYGPAVEVSYCPHFVVVSRVEVDEGAVEVVEVEVVGLVVVEGTVDVGLLDVDEVDLLDELELGAVPG
jgi:hypothetical protein